MIYIAYFEDKRGFVYGKKVEGNAALPSYLLTASIRIILPDDHFFLLLVDRTGRPIFGPRQFDADLRCEEGREALVKEFEKRLVLRLNDD